MPDHALPRHGYKNGVKVFGRTLDATVETDIHSTKSLSICTVEIGSRFARDGAKAPPAPQKLEQRRATLLP